MRSSVRIAAAASVAALISARLSLGQQVTYSPVLYVTSPIAATAGSVAVPNPNSVALPSSDYFASLFSGSVSALNDSGNVAFATNTSNGAATPTTENSVLISTETGTTTALGQANYAVSAAPSLTWTNSSSSTFTTIYLNSAGQTSVLASTSGGNAVFSERSGSLSQVLGASAAWNVSGTATTTSGYTTVTAINVMEANPSGQLAYVLNSNSVIATDLSTGSTAPAPTLIAAAGGVAPGTGGATFRTSVLGGMQINPSGQVSFAAWLLAGSGSPVVSASGATENDKGLWTNAGGSLSPGPPHARSGSHRQRWAGDQ